MPDLIEDSLREARGNSARFMNRVRFFLASGFVGLYVFVKYFLKLETLDRTFSLILAYWVGAGLLWYFSRKNNVVLRWSRVAIGAVDIPTATLIQWMNLPYSESAHATVMFTLSIYVFLTVMSSFTLRSHHLFICAAIAVAGFLLLASRVDLTIVSYIVAPLMLIAAAWMMSQLPRRQTALIREAAERKARRDRLARHFSPGVAELIESHEDPDEGEACELSVLFCDIRGFTRMSEAMEAPDVVRLLNEFHGTMVDTVFRHGGTLDKYLGDGLLAYFNAPARQTDHAERAVRCALAMIEDLDRFNGQRLKNDNAEPIRVGIGVHSGQAVVGEIGAIHRREYTAIGDTVNVGSRLQELTRQFESDVLVSEPVIRQIEPDSGIRFESAGTVAVRGRTQEIEVFFPGLA
ncbi:MAG: adenylate/guanylate cyclase domain-containing protein [Verrucomicrobiales bacterium]|nr:adenylate/guanylate cyclase domain-containing protein [Verrucomicrobiales bacterium]